MAIREEQETTVTGNRKEGVYYVYTADPVHRRLLDRAVEQGRATLRDSGEDYANYLVGSDVFDPIKGFKRKQRPLSDEERAALAERLASARSTQ